MSGPAKIGLKRKATEDPPDFLVLESRYKKVSTTNLRYIRVQHEKDVKGKRPKVEEETTVERPHELGVSEQVVEREKRVFQLASPRKRKGGEDVATFVERGAKFARRTEQCPPTGLNSGTLDVPKSPLTQPDKQQNAHVDTAGSGSPDPTNGDQKQLQELADYLHEAALEEVKREQVAPDDVVRETRHERAVAPRFTQSQYARYRQNRAAKNTHINDIEMADESEFVYDEYILAPTADIGATQASAYDNVGYLIIAEEDESLWQTYLDDEQSDKEFETDEDDENAEDYYGADYPEDELASDDEFNRNAYGYRAHGASDDEDAGADSDDEYDRMMNPFRKTTKQFAKYLQADDDSD